MMRTAEFQRACERICECLARDRFDPEAHEMMRSSEFLLSCAWLGLDPAEAVRRIAALAAKRRGDNSAAEPESVAVSA